MAETAVAEVQQDTETPASVEEAPQEEAVVAQPAGETPAQPDQSTETQPEFTRLPGETLDLIAEEYEEDLLSRPSVQARIQQEAQRQLAEVRGTPSEDAQYTQFVQKQGEAADRHEAALQQTAPILQQLARGEEVDPRALAGQINELTQASQQAIAYAVAAYGREAQVVANGHLDDWFTPIKDETITNLKGEKVKVEDFYRDMNRAYDSMLKGQDARASQNYLRMALHLAREGGKVEGAKEQSTRGLKELDRRTKLARNSAEIQEQAKQIAARRNGGTAPAAEGSPRSGPLTVEEAQNLPIDELIKRTQAP